MVKKWDGTERRIVHEQREGRRISDQRCPDHHLLWLHHDKDTEEHRNLVCTKLTDLRTALSREVDRLQETAQTSLAREVSRLEKVDESLKKVDDALDLKIETLKNTIVGKYWFRIVVGFLCAGLIAVGFQQNWAFSKILENQKDFALMLNNVENRQIQVMQRLKTLEDTHIPGAK